MARFQVTVGLDWEYDLDRALADVGAHSVKAEQRTIKGTEYVVIADFLSPYTEKELAVDLAWLMEVAPEVVEV